MKPSLKVAVAGLLTAAIAGGGLLAFASPAFAAQSAPPWEPDGNAAPPYGNLTFYDVNGNQVTSGTNDLASPFAYVVAGTAANAGAYNATVNFYNPQPGVLPANWTGTSEAGTTTFLPASSLPAGTPADVAAFAPTYPVSAVTPNITTWLGSNTPSTTTGYANTIEVRLTDSGTHGNAPGTYWESDIGYNNTSSAITVDGTNVPADGWALLFPFTTPTTTSLTASAIGGGQVTLTATVSPTESGFVQFYDGSTGGTYLADSAEGAGPTFTYTYSPAAGTHDYTASFIPDSPGDETGANSASATIVGGSISSGVTLTLTGTTTTLLASTNSIGYDQPVTFTATVTAADSTTQAGTVEFFDGTTAITGCTSVAVNPPTSAICTTSSLPLGSDSVTATFTPTSNLYVLSTSSPQVVTVSAAGTTTTLSTTTSSVVIGTSVTFTATVSASDSTTQAGAVEFFDGTTAITGCTSVAINPPASAICTTSSLPLGSNSVTATFTPTSSNYASSTSAAVVVTVTPPPNSCSYNGSPPPTLATPCGEIQNIEVVVNPGTITITTPYTSSNPFVLPPMTLSSDGTYFQSSATFPSNSEPYASDIVVTSTLAPAYAWTLSVSASALSNGSGGTIPSTGLGLTAGVLDNSTSTAGPFSAYPGTVTFHNIAALNPSPVDGHGTGPGLSSTPQSWATSSVADGTAVMQGTLTLDAATSTPAGTYNGTISFSVT